MQYKIYSKITGYKYRFLPWLMWNWKTSSKRVISASENQLLDCQDEYIKVLINFFYHLSRVQTICSKKVMKDCFGFVIEKKTSKIAGHGVLVTDGLVSKSSLVALYPGTVYYPMEPVFFQSLGNQFILKCKDGILIDGNNRGLSKKIYRSSAARDLIGGFSTCDTTWLTNSVINPLAIGQYVNNENKKYPANVCYQELDIPLSFALPLMKFIPNVHFSSQCYNEEDINASTRFIRTVVLIALKDIPEGEELFSSYFTEIIE